MLTRPGSTPGSGWLRSISERLTSAPADPQSPSRRFWVGYIAFMLLVFLILPIVQRRSMRSYDMRDTHAYETSVRWAGLPLFAIGPAPVAIVAIGGRPRGVIAVGGLALGVIAVGGLAAGGIAIGGLSIGLMAFAGLAIGWRALGGLAVGYHAAGGLAVGGYAYAGNGVAIGYHEACGRQMEKLIG
jgi:4-amino-4-deoxy-L-arabinose transferase-like glycosyltransferase